MIYLRRQKDLTRIVKYLTKCISKKRKLHGILEKLEAIHKKEPVYIGTDGEKEVRIVIGNQIAYTRCHPKDTFDLARGVTICICDILKKKDILFEDWIIKNMAKIMNEFNKLNEEIITPTDKAKRELDKYGIKLPKITKEI